MNTGIAVGGPMDGRMLSHKGEVWDYHKSPESLVGPIDHSDMDATKAALAVISDRGRYYFTDMTYLHHSRGPSTGRRIGFWVEHDKTLDDALTAVLVRYQEPRKEKVLLRRAFWVIHRLFSGEAPDQEASDILYAIKEQIEIEEKRT